MICGAHCFLPLSFNLESGNFSQLSFGKSFDGVTYCSVLLPSVAGVGFSSFFFLSATFMLISYFSLLMIGGSIYFRMPACVVLFLFSCGVCSFFYHADININPSIVQFHVCVRVVDHSLLCVIAHFVALFFLVSVDLVSDCFDSIL